LVRITVNNGQAAKAVPFIIDKLRTDDIHVPIIGDFHFNGHTLLTQFPDTAKMLSKFRINPGNTGKKNRRDENFVTIVEQACKWEKPVRRST
jgi:(E)-4-hydroxy-3-methylbut-2-enyl-diphosphate synthase